MGKSVIQKHKRLINKLSDLRTEDMFIGIDLEEMVKSRKNLIRHYSIVCNYIHNEENNLKDTFSYEIRKNELMSMIENKKLRIAELLKDKIESKKEIKKVHKQLSELL